jgi:large-conductance mechanosensitive channel
MSQLLVQNLVNFTIFRFLVFFIIEKAGKTIFLKKRHLKKPVETQFEAVFGGFYKIPSTVL